MTLRLKDKQVIVADLADVAKKAISVVIADYRGLTVAEMTELRAKARASNVYIRVVRNTLAKRALQDTAFVCVNEVLCGPLFLAFANDEPGAAARLIREFVKTHENLKVKALVVGGVLLAAKDLARVADLPSRFEALSMLMGTMLAPITKLARTLAEPYAKLTRTVAAIGEQKKSV